MKTTPGVAFGFLLLCLPSCSQDAADPTDTVIVSDSAGIEIVESFAPAWGDGSRRIDPEPIVRFGGSLGEGPFELSTISVGVFLEDGSIAVGDRVSRTVRVFRADGEHIRTFGRSGDGPGEFNTIAWISSWGPDSIAVHDAGLRRMTVFSRRDEGLRVVGNPMQGNYMPFNRLDDGSLMFWNPGDFRWIPTPGLVWDSTWVIRVASDGAITDTIRNQPLILRRIAQDGNRLGLQLGPWSAHAGTSIGYVWGTQDRFEFRVYAPDGPLQRIFRRPIDPVAVDEAVQDRYRTGVIERSRRRGGDAAADAVSTGFSDDTHWNEWLPLFGTIFADTDDRVWVSEWVFPDQEGEPRTWSLFDSTGVWLGDLTSPAGVHLIDSRADRVLGIGADKFDVPVIQVHRILQEPSR